MKALVCEMCGCQEIVKQDGMYVCQNCGTKYSVEEAKKMMIEGTVNVQGTVKVDNSEMISNYYNLAESAYQSDNTREAENYCNKILEIDPRNYKAWLLKGKAAGWQSTTANSRIEEAVNCFIKAIDFSSQEESEITKKSVFSEAKNLFIAMLKLDCSHFESFPSEENASIIVNHTYGILKLCCTILISKCVVSIDDLENDMALIISNTATHAWNNKITTDFKSDVHPSKYAWERFVDQGDSVLKLYKAAIALRKDKDKKNVTTYKNMICVQEELCVSCSYTYYNGSYWKSTRLSDEAIAARQSEINKWYSKIQEIDPTFQIPQQEPASGGCYVATCVYGSYDCPEVWTLRRYRDFSLAKTWHGRAFIRTYYAISPTLVKWFGNTKWFKKMWRGKLDRMVRKLQDKGYESTKYYDR